jgi:hypothetical protein
MSIDDNYRYPSTSITLSSWNNQLLDDEQHMIPCNSFLRRDKPQLEYRYCSIAFIFQIGLAQWVVARRSGVLQNTIGSPWRHFKQSSYIQYRNTSGRTRIPWLHHDAIGFLNIWNITIAQVVHFRSVLLIIWVKQRLFVRIQCKQTEEIVDKL